MQLTLALILCCKILKFGSSKFWCFFMSGPFGRFLIPKKKSVISDVALHHVCLVCAVLQVYLHVILCDFQVFSISHCSLCLSEYKSVLLLFNYALIH